MLAIATATEPLDRPIAGIVISCSHDWRYLISDHHNRWYQCANCQALAPDVEAAAPRPSEILTPDR